jgi:hypothetical protein
LVAATANGYYALQNNTAGSAVLPLDVLLLKARGQHGRQAAPVAPGHFPL